MINPFKEVNWNPGPAERRSFARSLVIGFPCLALVWLVIGWMHSGQWHVKPALMVGGIGAAMGWLFLVLPGIARPFYMAWYLLACSIGLVMGNVLLTVVYLVFVTGIGLALRASGRKPLGQNLDRQAESYWLDVAPVSDPRRYYNQF